MTENMENMFNDIMCALFQCFPKEHIDYCFAECYPINPISYGEYVMFEFVKYSYFESLEKHPLRFYLNYSADDENHSERMRYARVLKYTQRYKDLNYRLLVNEASCDPSKLQSLLQKDMHDMSNRVEGYELSRMDMFEHENIQSLGIIKAIVEKRIFSSKKVSNGVFIELFNEYDEWVKDLISKSKESDEELLFTTMAFFTFEWKYCLEFIYLVADYMEKEQINDVDFYTLWALALPLKFDSRLGFGLAGDNRMVKERQWLITDFIEQGEASTKLKWYRNKYVEIVGLTVLFNNKTCNDGGLYKEWFKRNTNLDDWASFIREYDLFAIWHKKEWTNKKITNARKILELLTPIR